MPQGYSRPRTFTRLYQRRAVSDRCVDRRPTVKGLLYAYRVAFKGIHLLQVGEVEPNVNVLAPLFGFEAIITALVAQRRAGDEHAGLNASEVATHTSTLDGLTNQLLVAKEHSPLPPECVNTAAINQWLVGLPSVETEKI